MKFHIAPPRLPSHFETRGINRGYYGAMALLRVHTAWANFDVDSILVRFSKLNSMFTRPTNEFKINLAKETSGGCFGETDSPPPIRFNVSLQCGRAHRTQANLLWSDNTSFPESASGGLCLLLSAHSRTLYNQLSFSLSATLSLSLRHNERLTLVRPNGGLKLHIAKVLAASRELLCATEGG